MFHIIYRTTDVKSSKLWTHKWPALYISGFIAQLLRASQLYREVTGSNPVEILTFSGFYIPNSTLCTCQPAVSFRQNSVTLIRFGLQKFSFSFDFLNLFSLISHCEPRIFALLERKSEEATIAGHPLGAGSLWLSTYFFFRNFATYCSSLLDLRSNIFFVTSFFAFLRLSSFTY